jgi:hypothetical protein
MAVPEKREIAPNQNIGMTKMTSMSRVKRETLTLVEHVSNQVCISPIGFSPMVEQEVLEELELPNSIVTGSRCLLSLQSTDSNTNMSSSKHVHIIGPIPNSQSSHLRQSCSHHLHHLCFLLG